MANLRGGDGADLVGEDQGAGIEGFLFVERDAKGGVDHADVAALRILNNNIKAIEAGAQRDGLLVDGRKVYGRLEERVGKIGW